MDVLHFLLNVFETVNILMDDSITSNVMCIIYKVL